MELYMKTPPEGRHSCRIQSAAVADWIMIENIVLFWCPCVFCIKGESYLLGLRTSNLSSPQDIITLKIKQHFRDLMAIVPSPYDSKATGEISVKQYRNLYAKADDKLKEPGGGGFSGTSPCRHHQVDSPETRKLQVLPWILPIPYNHTGFGSGKYKTRERLFHSYPISKAWYQATTLGELYCQKRNNQVAYDYWIEDFHVHGDTFTDDNIKNYSIDKEPTSLEELAANNLDDVIIVQSSYMQQLAFHAQLNVAKYKAQYPDPPAPQAETGRQWIWWRLSISSKNISHATMTCLPFWNVHKLRCHWQPGQTNVSQWNMLKWCTLVAVFTA